MSSKQKAEEIFNSLVELTNQFTGSAESHTELFVRRCCYSVITQVYMHVDNGGERAFWKEVRDYTQKLKIKK